MVWTPICLLGSMLIELDLEFRTSIYGERESPEVNIPPTYRNGNGQTIPYRTFYNTILHESEGDDGDGSCRNRGIGEELFGRNCDPWLFKEYHRDMSDSNLQIAPGPIHILFVGARASLIRKCKCAPATFIDLMPRCPTWPGFEDWVLQLVGCGSEFSGGRWMFPTGRTSLYLPCIAQEFVDRTEDCVLLDKTDKEAFEKVNSEYLSWASSVDLTEVFRLVSWLKGISRTGIYEFHHPSLHIARLLGPKVLASTERVKDLGLCPQRVWSLAQNSPGQQISMLTLLPCMPSVPCIWSHTGHDACVPDYCAHLYLDFTGVEQLHMCPDPHTNCRKTEGLFPHDKLVAAIERQLEHTDTFIPTAWALDGLSIINEDQPFMAISHVWSDGTGTGTWPRGIVNGCVYRTFCIIAASLGCEGIWWDATCLPTEKKARIHAINNMHNNYARAKVTLVHDRYLSTMQWVTPAEACFAIVMSSWFTRGWTALELAVSRPGTVQVLFSDKGSLRLSKLDEIMAKKGEVTHSYHHVATDLIRSVMGKINTLNDLLTALGPRYTSWARDKAIIAGLLVGVENPASLSQIEIYQAVLRRLSKVQIGNLFHGMTTMGTAGFRWCPSDLFRMPPSRKGGHIALRVKENGDLVGCVSLSCLSMYAANMSILPADNHPLMRARTEFALANPRGYILVKDPSNYARGLILKVKLEHKEPMDCEIVGTVVLGQPDAVAKLADHGSVDIRLCDVGEESKASEDIYACLVAVKWRIDRALPMACCCQPDISVPSTTPEPIDQSQTASPPLSRLICALTWRILVPFLLIVLLISYLSISKLKC